MPPIFKMSDYYRQNLDQLSYSGNQCGTPRNAVLDTLFSDQQSSSVAGGGESVLTLSAAGGEFSLQDDRLIDATIILLFRDGLNWYETTDPFSFTTKEFQFYPSGDEDLSLDPGSILFPGDPFPPLQPNEKVTVSYIASGAVVVITEPVTLAQAKAWLKVTHDDDDDIISALITAARQICEGYTDLSFVERTVTAVVKNELDNIRLPYGPVGYITDVFDKDGNGITTGYTLTGVANKRFCYRCSYAEVIYTAGYAVLPQQFKTALKMQLSWMYVHRGDEDLSLIAPDAKAILSPYRAIV